MSYLSLLDTACIFEILVRLSYRDLRSILIMNPCLYRITNSKHFNQEWKKHNIKVVETKFDNGFTLKAETDKEGITHGTSYDYSPTGVLWFQKEYIQGKVVSVCEWPNQCFVRRDYIYFNNMTYRISEVRHAETNDLISRALHRDSYRTGLEWEHSTRGSIVLCDYGPDTRTEVRVQWFPNGNMEYMRTNIKECRWWQNGVKRFDKPLKNGILHGLSKQWNEHGMLTHSAEYINGKMINHAEYVNYFRWFIDRRL